MKQSDFRIKSILLIILLFTSIGLYPRNQKQTSPELSRRIDSLLNTLNTLKNDTSKVITLGKICWNYKNTNPEKASQYGLQALQLAERINYKKGIAASCNYLGGICNYLGDYQKSTTYYERSLVLKKELGDQAGIAELYSNIGNIYFFQGNYSRALNLYQDALKSYISVKDSSGAAVTHILIGNVHYTQNDYNHALEYYQKALKGLTGPDDKSYRASCNNNIGNIYMTLGNNRQALAHYQAALKILEDLNDLNGQAICYNNIGLVFENLRCYQASLENYNKSFEIAAKFGDKNGESCALGNISQSYIYLKKYNEAIKFAKKDLEIATGIGAIENQKYAYIHLADAYDSLKDYKNAYYYTKLFKSANDSIFSEKSSEQIKEMETRYQTEKKQQQIELQKTQIEKNEAEMKRQKTQRNALVVGLILFLGLIIMVYRSYRIKKKANQLLAIKNQEIMQQKEEIQAQRDLVVKQRDLISDQKEQITESIQYAFRIQSAVIPSEEAVSKIIKDFFIFYKPRDIVSGDFYWIGEKENKLIVIAADCTGHGVPGAFMSMLGVAFLNEIINRSMITSPSDILESLRDNIIKALKQHGKEETYSDGMDVVAVTINTTEKSIEYAGANNPLLIMRASGEAFQEIKGDKMPIGTHDSMGCFTLHELNLDTGDIIYMFSDGFEDQFGGTKGKKFLSKNLKNLLQAICTKPMNIQKQELSQTFENWKGDHEQVDDVMVIGIKI